MRKYQRGLSLIGTLFVAAAVIGGLVLAMRAVPVYTEYFAIKRAVNAIASGADVQSPEAIRTAFDKRADVENIETVKPTDLIISKQDGRFVVSVDWQRTIPLVANVSLLFQFSVTNAADPAAAAQ